MKTLLVLSAAVFAVYPEMWVLAPLAAGLALKAIRMAGAYILLKLGNQLHKKHWTR